MEKIDCIYNANYYLFLFISKLPLDCLQWPCALAEAGTSLNPILFWCENEFCCSPYICAHHILKIC